MSEWTIERAGEFLRHGRWFAQQPEEFCAAVLSRSAIRTFEAHQRICHKGDPPSGVYSVLEGQVNLVAEREPGASLFYNFIEPGSWFGQGNCLDRQPVLLDAVAAQRSVVLHFPLAEFDAVLERHPAYYRCWALMLSEAWRTTLGQYLDSKAFEARRRVNQELLTLATRVGQPYGDGIRLKVRLTQSDFASLVGVTRQYASRFIGELRAAGVIDWRGSMIAVKDVSRLSEMAGLSAN
ncbi:MAG TPA: Crp/Fnr family transcriptional regulator [Aestuariivirgaceae bacterium]|jgi:CRP/FNR family cyclic AMP-dependent transcriptional regulator|nr:Crp/Fnr family transcriptional regulator [Aestuariivirgaceae bacterium]